MAIWCLFGHKWDGCKCTRCGKEHNFDRHRVCTICGARLVDESEDVVIYGSCSCPNGSGYGCTGDPSTCINAEYADDYRMRKSVTRTYILYPDGTKNPY